MLCVSLMPRTTDDALAALAHAAPDADCAELRLDAMIEFDLPRLLADPPCPVIVTYRPTREGGLYDGPEDARLDTLRRAAALGAHYLDVEHDALAPLGKVKRAKRIVSYHNLHETPDDLDALYDRLVRTGADAVKVAVTANHILDVVPVLRLLRRARVPTIALAMGPRGILTRILAPKFGAFLTYAAPDADQPEAGPGQVTLADMRRLYRVPRIGPKTRVFGVIADPVGHSLSPRIHNAAFAKAGLDAVYLPFWVEGDPAPFVQAMREFDFDGYSVTIPHKQAVMKALDEIDPLARRIGALNTVHRRRDGSLFGTNTDWTAGMASIEAVVGQRWLRGKRALILGAGGVGRAMAFGLCQRQANVTITDVDTARAESLARDVGVGTCPVEQIYRQPCDILLNCTPVGMHPNTADTPAPADMLRPDMVLYDAVYNPLETRLVRDAQEAGCRVIPGIDHFVRQAVEQFELWTGRPAPLDTMRDVCVQALALT